MNELAKHNKVQENENEDVHLEQRCSFQVNAKYDLIQETGPAHSKKFEVRLTVGDETYTGIGTSIKRAQQIGELYEKSNENKIFSSHFHVCLSISS